MGDAFDWSRVVVCERLVLHLSWEEVRKGLVGWLGKEVSLFSYQINRAFFKCDSKEDMLEACRTSQVLIDGVNEVRLWSWEQGLANFTPMIVSYGGWIGITGLPLHWWNNHFFRRIGDECGGFLDLDTQTERWTYLHEAKIKIKKNFSGLLPESLNLVEGRESYHIKLRPISPAFRPAETVSRTGHRNGTGVSEEGGSAYRGRIGVDFGPITDSVPDNNEVRVSKLASGQGGLGSGHGSHPGRGNGKVTDQRRRGDRCYHAKGGVGMSGSGFESQVGGCSDRGKTDMRQGDHVGEEEDGGTRGAVCSKGQGEADGPMCAGPNQVVILAQNQCCGQSKETVELRGGGAGPLMLRKSDGLLVPREDPINSGLGLSQEARRPRILDSGPIVTKHMIMPQTREEGGMLRTRKTKEQDSLDRTKTAVTQSKPKFKFLAKFGRANGVAGNGFTMRTFSSDG